MRFGRRKLVFVDRSYDPRVSSAVWGETDDDSRPLEADQRHSDVQGHDLFDHGLQRLHGEGAHLVFGKKGSTTLGTSVSFCQLAEVWKTSNKLAKHDMRLTKSLISVVRHQIIGFAQDVQNGEASEFCCDIAVEAPRESSSQTSPQHQTNELSFLVRHRTLLISV